MSDRRPRDPLASALAELPRHRASARFTDDVMAELTHRSQAQETSSGRVLWATALSLILIVALAIGFGYQRHQSAKRAHQNQVEELKTRYEELLDEIATVRQEAATPQTQIYLGGDERIDLILDLTQIPPSPGPGGDRNEVRPASLEP